MTNIDNCRTKTEPANSFSTVDTYSQQVSVLTVENFMPTNCYSNIYSGTFLPISMVGSL